MKLNGVVRVMGVETGQYEGKPNWKVGLMQGLESKILYIDQPTYEKFYNIPIATEIDVVLDFAERNGKTYWSLVDYHVIQAKKVV